MRGLAVSFFAACINDESKKPIKILRDLNIRSCNNATDRFFTEASNSTVALSGMRFFYLTRKLMLTIAGTVLTYEIILLQLNLNYTQVATCDA